VHVVIDSWMIMKTVQWKFILIAHCKFKVATGVIPFSIKFILLNLQCMTPMVIQGSGKINLQFIITTFIALYECSILHIFTVIELASLDFSLCSDNTAVNYSNRTVSHNCNWIFIAYVIDSYTSSYGLLVVSQIS